GESRECCCASTDPGSGQGPHDTDLPPHVDTDADGAAKTIHQAQLSSSSLQKILTEQGMPEIDPLTKARRLRGCSSCGSADGWRSRQ
ncbi:MAG TPA: hypothetical protein VFZ10_14610, partial [Geminicoccaceae bacterium]